MRWQLTLSEIRARKLELARLDPRAGMPVLPPVGATPQAIASAERRLGRPLPPSYREMLAQHNGLPQFYQGAALLDARHLALGSYVELCRMVVDAPELAGGGGPPLFPFGVDPAGETFFAWDPSRVAADGELEVVVWMNEIGARVESFPVFLDMVLDMLVAEIAERRHLGVTVPGSHRRPRVSASSLGFQAA
jgi:hypothetical protein